MCPGGSPRRSSSPEFRLQDASREARKWARFCEENKDLGQRCTPSRLFKKALVLPPIHRNPSAKMESSLRLAVLLLLATGAVALEDLNHEAAAQRAKRWSGMSVFDSLRGKERPPQPAPTKAPAGGDPKPSQPVGGNGVGFNLEDALQPAQKPLDDPSGESCQGGLLEKLNAVIENQNQQLRLLKQLTPSSRFYDRGTR